jgi:hypothetical protein
MVTEFKSIRKEDCPCKKTDCPRWGLCGICREYHYAKGKKPFCERKKYLKILSRKQKGVQHEMQP